MTLPASGNPISFSQVDVELSFSATAQISLNDTAVRALFGVASGAISLSNGYGKSSVVATSFHTQFCNNSAIGNAPYALLGQSVCDPVSNCYQYSAPVLHMKGTSNLIYKGHKLVKQNIDGNVRNFLWTCGGVDVCSNYSPTRGVAVSRDCSCNIYTFNSVRNLVGTYCAYNNRTCGTYVSDIRVSKYTPTGNTIWAVTFGGGSSACPSYPSRPYTASAGACASQYLKYRLCDGITDSSGNAYIAGLVPRAKDNANKPTTFIAKINSSGVVQWAFQSILNPNNLTAPYYNYQASYRTLSVDSSGNVYSVGSYPTGVTCNVPNNTAVTSLSYSPYYTPIITKLNSSGSLVWQKKLNGSWYDRSYIKSTIDSSGNLYLQLNFYNTALTFKGVPTIIKMDSTGAIVWAKEFRDSYQGNGYGPPFYRPCAVNSSPGGIALDNSNNVYFYYGTQSTVPNNSTSYVPSYYVVGKLSCSGSLQWQRFLGASTSGYGGGFLHTVSTPFSRGLTIDPSGNYYSMSVGGDIPPAPPGKHASIFRAPTDGSLASNTAYCVGTYGFHCPQQSYFLNPLTFYYSTYPFKNNFCGNSVWNVTSSTANVSNATITNYTCISLYSYNSTNTNPKFVCVVSCARSQMYTQFTI